MRPQFEKAVMYYMETGDIWLGGDMVADTDDDIYLSIVDELQQPESVVEGEWETRVPSTLTIVQGKSAFLEEEGLPCCHDDTPEQKNTIVADGNTLTLLKDTTL
jgi:hypothetical protein